METVDIEKYDQEMEEAETEEEKTRVKFEFQKKKDLFTRRLALIK